MLKKMILGVAASLAICSLAYAAVDLNTATQQQLEAVSGLGPAKAKAIVEFRSKNGPFKTTEDVMKVPGIKQGVYNLIKTEVTVGSKQVAATTATKK